MNRFAVEHLDPFLTSTEADAMLAIAESFGSFGTYMDEATSEGLGENLPQRFDAALNYLEAGIDGGGNADDPETAISRTNYFRETYVYGDAIKAPGIEPFINSGRLLSAAHTVSGCDIIVPAIVYANLLIPGQELAIHTDVPEFLGANRKLLPQWLLVCMHHSGLFEEWRIPIVTCVSWFGSGQGGAFTYYPDGPQGQRRSIPATHNTAIVLDTDSVFHGVERVSGPRPSLPPITKTTRLHHRGGHDWALHEGEMVLGEYRTGEIRYSISWKAYAFVDDQARRRWQSGTDDLTQAFIVARLEAQLRDRGIISGPRPDPDTFARLLVSHYIQFPGQGAITA